MIGPRTGLVIGLGQPDRGDDAVGPEVARHVATLAVPHVRVVEHEDPTDLLDAWEGHDTVVLVDAVSSGAVPGTLHVLDAGAAGVVVGGAAWRATGRGGTHGWGIGEVVALARALGRLPQRLVILGVEAEQFDHGAPLSAPVRDAVPQAAAAVLSALAPGPWVHSRGERAAMCLAVPGRLTDAWDVGGTPMSRVATAARPRRCAWCASRSPGSAAATPSSSAFVSAARRDVGARDPGHLQPDRRRRYERARRLRTSGVTCWTQVMLRWSAFA